MVKGFRQIASLTVLSRVFGLVRDISYFYFFGASGLLDAWFIAFKIPNLSRRLFGEGAAAASLIPVYSRELHKDPENARLLARTVLTVIFVILAGLVLLGWGGMWLFAALSDINPDTRLILSLTSIMLPYMLMICMVAIMAGLLHVHGHFAAPAAAPVLLNIFIIVSLLTAGLVFGLEGAAMLFVVAVAVLAAGLAQIGMQIPFLRANGVPLKPAWQVRSEAFGHILAMMGPMIIGLTATQINTLFDDLIAWWFSSSPAKGEYFTLMGRRFAYPLQRGCVSYLNAAQRLYQMPLGVLGISLATAIFPLMSTKAAKNDLNGLTRTISKGLKAALFVGAPATVGLLLVARPLVAAAFEHGDKFTAADTHTAATTLLFYALGLTGFFVQQIATRAFYAMHEPRIPMRSALIAVAANIVLNLSLIWVLGTGGLACSTAICSYIQITILVGTLRMRLGANLFEGMRHAFMGTAASTAVMAVVGLLLRYLLRGLSHAFVADLLRLAVIVPVCGGVYLSSARLFKVEMLQLLTSRGRERGL